MAGYQTEFENSKGVKYVQQVTTIGGDLAGQRFFVKETMEEVLSNEQWEEMMS